MAFRLEADKSKNHSPEVNKLVVKIKMAGCQITRLYPGGRCEESGSGTLNGKK